MSASKPVVCIVIVNFNGAEDTLSCLASLDSIDYIRMKKKKKKKDD